MLEQIAAPIASFTGDGAYDSDETYKAVRRHSPSTSIIVPPRSRKTDDTLHGPPEQRDWHSKTIAEPGRMRWQAITDYGRRAKAETTMGRYKSIIGKRRRSRKFAHQQTEVTLGCSALNHMMGCARPKSVPVKTTTA